jgi:hypothetical protein
MACGFNRQAPLSSLPTHLKYTRTQGVHFIKVGKMLVSIGRERLEGFGCIPVIIKPHISSSVSSSLDRFTVLNGMIICFIRSFYTHTSEVHHQFIWKPARYSSN